MHGLPGGGAEMLVDGVRMDISPKKGHPDNLAKRVMEEAQSLGLITSATNVFGFGESLEDRIKTYEKNTRVTSIKPSKSSDWFYLFYRMAGSAGNEYVW